MAKTFGPLRRVVRVGDLGNGWAKLYLACGHTAMRLVGSFRLNIPTRTHCESCGRVRLLGEGTDNG